LEGVARWEEVTWELFIKVKDEDLLAEGEVGIGTVEAEVVPVQIATASLPSAVGIKLFTSVEAFGLGKETKVSCF